MQVEHKRIVSKMLKWRKDGEISGFGENSEHKKCLKLVEKNSFSIGICYYGRTRLYVKKGESATKSSK